MDPATSFSIACGVVQLLQFGIEVGRECYEIYSSTSGLTNKHEFLKSSADQTGQLVQRIQARLQNVCYVQALTKEDKQVLDAAETCSAAARELQEVFDDLQPYSTQSRHRALELMLKGRLKRAKVEDLNNRMRGCQKSMDTALLASISQRIDVADSKQNEIMRQIDLGALQQTRGFQEIALLIQGLINRLQEVEISSKDQGRQTRALIEQTHQDNRDHIQLKQLLDSLYFPAIAAREENIHEAYSDTFQWIFDDAEDAVRPWSNYVHWLRKDRRLYWINGKAGSGKSTLMSFIVHSRKLKEHLYAWASASQSDLAVLHHFFWRSGTVEQKSKSGLIRTLMRQLVTARPSLVVALDTMPTQPITWTEARLRADFEALVEESKQGPRPLNIAIFIDGLDEYNGSHVDQVDLAAFVKRLCIHPNVKVCASSRPEQAYRDAFDYCAQLRLHDLTRTDMSIYIRGRIESMPTLKELQDANPRAVQHLIESICRNADGVFLWASLVTNDVMDGLICGDSLEMLRARLERADKTLEGLFEQLLGRIDPIHRSKSAKYLQVMALKENGRISFLELLLVDQQKLEAMIPTTDDQARNIRSAAETFKKEGTALKRHIVARCAGLLTVDEQPCRSCLAHDEQNPVGRLCAHYNDHINVDFIHRSAHDFLSDNGKARDFLTISGTDDGLMLLDISRALVQISRCPFIIGNELRNGNWSEWATRMLSRLMPIIRSLDDRDHIRAAGVIEGFDAGFTQTLAFQRQHRPEDIYESVPSNSNWVAVLGHTHIKDTSRDLVGYAMEWGLTRYGLGKLQICPREEQRELATYLLQCARYGELFRWTQNSMDVVALEQLLSYGADPNTVHVIRDCPVTKWQLLLMEMATTIVPQGTWEANQTDYSPSDQREMMRTTTAAFLKAGADMCAEWTFALQEQDPVEFIEFETFKLYYVYEAGWIVLQLDEGVDEHNRLRDQFPVADAARYPRVKVVGAPASRSPFRWFEDLNRIPGIYESDSTFTPTEEQSKALGKAMYIWQYSEEGSGEKRDNAAALMKLLEGVYSDLYETHHQASAAQQEVAPPG